MAAGPVATRGAVSVEGLRRAYGVVVALDGVSLELPAGIRANPAIFPPPVVLARTELIEDLGEATALYDRLWTEVKASR